MKYCLSAVLKLPCKHILTCHRYVDPTSELAEISHYSNLSFKINGLKDDSNPFVSLTRWNANRCYSYLLFEAFEILFSTLSFFDFNSYKIVKESDNKMNKAFNFAFMIIADEMEF